MSLRLAFVLLLTCVSFPLMARDIRQMDPDSGAASDDTAQSADASAPAATPRPTARTVHPTARPRPPTVRSGGDGVGDIRPPRWHSFLPGMFR